MDLPARCTLLTPHVRDCLLGEQMRPLGPHYWYCMDAQLLAINLLLTKPALQKPSVPALFAHPLCAVVSLGGARRSCRAATSNGRGSAPCPSGHTAQRLVLEWLAAGPTNSNKASASTGPLAFEGIASTGGTTGTAGVAQLGLRGCCWAKLWHMSLPVRNV